MQIKNAIVSLTACAAIVTFAGCSKTESTAPEISTNTATMTDSAKDMAGKVGDTLKDTASQAVAAATNSVSEVTSTFNDGVAKAKNFIADKDYQGALAKLADLSSLKLTDEQMKIVNDLKAEVQTLISKNATGAAADAAKGLFGK